MMSQLHPSAFRLRRSAVLIGACAGLLTLPAAAADPLHLRLDWSWQVLHSAFLLAKEKGYYEEAGLDVTIEQGQGSKTTTLLVGEGESPVGHVNLSTAAQSIASGVPITAIAGIAQQGPSA